MDKLKKMIKNFIQITDHLVDLIALILILSMMSLSGYMLWDSNQIYEKADAKVYEPYMPTRNHSKSFKELQQINNDVIGWLKVNNTHINYPLVQCENDDKYMNTDVEGNYSLSGSIFLHAENNPHFTDFNNIIYGHHMEKHMMFGDIGEFTNQNFFNKHHYGNLYYDGINHGIEFIAIMQLDAYNERAFNVCISEEAKQEYDSQAEYDLLILLDVSSPDRIGVAGEALKTAKKTAADILQASLFLLSPILSVYQRRRML